MKRAVMAALAALAVSVTGHGGGVASAEKASASYYPTHLGGGGSSKFDKDLDLLLDPTPSYLPAPSLGGGGGLGGGNAGLQDDFFGAPIKAFPTHDVFHASAAAKTLPNAELKTRSAPKSPAQFVAKDPSEDCRFELDGDEFDLTPLRLADGMKPYTATDQARMKYEFNVCGLITREGAAQRSNAMIAQYTPGPNPSLDGVIARWDAKPRPVWSYIDERRPEAGVKMVVQNGDDCSFRGVHKTREAIVFFQCDRRAGKLGRISVSETSTCTYVLVVPTELACVGEAGSSWGWSFLTLLFVFSAVYFGLGFLYIRYRTGAEGVAAIPNREFWEDLPTLVKDGMAYTYERFSFYKGEWQAGKAGDGI